MFSGKKHITDLDRLTSCYAFIFNVRHKSLRGFDGENKGIISLLAKELLALDDGVISAYYRIGVSQSRSTEIPQTFYRGTIHHKNIV